MITPSFLLAMEDLRVTDPPKSLWHLYAIVRIVAYGETWRMGQALFNVLASLRPEISEAIRGTDADPFYCGGEKYWQDPRWEKAVAKIELMFKELK